MRPPDVERLERELQIRLPEAYRGVLLAFPFPAKAGNADFPLFDDADVLIQRQRTSRAGNGPAAYLFIGADGPEGCYVLDLSRSPEEVLFLEEGDPGRVTPIGATIDEFVEALQEEADTRQRPVDVGPTLRSSRARWVLVLLAGVVGVGALVAWRLLGGR